MRSAQTDLDYVSAGKNAGNRSITLVWTMTISASEGCYMTTDEGSTKSSKLVVFQLIYVSGATVPFTDSDLDELLEKARTYNSTLDITGVLLYSEGTFFQVLEGEQQAVEELYEKISLDTRHDKVLMLARRKLKERNFGEWRMGFVRDQETVRNLPGFVDFFSSGGQTFLDLMGDSKRIREILDGFNQGRWRRQPAIS